MSDAAVRGRGWSQKLQRDGKAEGTVSPVFADHPVFSPAWFVPSPPGLHLTAQEAGCFCPCCDESVTSSLICVA